MRSLASMQFTTCDRKKFFSTMEEARRIASLRSRAEGFPLYVYSCRQCRGYHLTKQPPTHIERQEKLRRDDAVLVQRNYAENIVSYLVGAALKRRFA
jgi:hypothetical protein